MEEKKIIFYTKNNDEIILRCKYAKSYYEKIKGLMNVKSLQSHEGMIFFFKFPWFRFFWMKNVEIPLDIIFINRKKQVLNYYEADVEKGILYKLYFSHGLCKYVIECNKGLCKKNKINKGSKIKIK